MFGIKHQESSHEEQLSEAEQAEQKLVKWLHERLLDLIEMDIEEGKIKKYIQDYLAEHKKRSVLDVTEEDRENLYDGISFKCLEEQNNKQN